MLYNYCPSVGEKPREALVHMIYCLGQQFSWFLDNDYMAVSQIASLRIFVKCNNNVISNC